MLAFSEEATLWVVFEGITSVDIVYMTVEDVFLFLERCPNVVELALEQLETSYADQQTGNERSLAFSNGLTLQSVQSVKLSFLIDAYHDDTPTTFTIMILDRLTLPSLASLTLENRFPSPDTVLSTLRHCPMPVDQLAGLISRSRYNITSLKFDNMPMSKATLDDLLRLTPSLIDLNLA
ncbi:hypothetical protein D9758_010934 [Tetrapyrgos nigripes]|uniref:Uncharacterized protein n=1 Tax=Tetrapyrgos nigripes TaxID=182062 RepID=A0A8H5CV29_9AGAR|nr:hypothetical protein D9758_010934 [Tetrapyrgos nigripes]